MAENEAGTQPADDERFLYTCLVDWVGDRELQMTFKGSVAEYLLYRFQIRYQEPDAGRFLSYGVKAAVDWELDPDLRDKFSGNFSLFMNQRRSEAHDAAVRPRQELGRKKENNKP